MEIRHGVQNPANPVQIPSHSRKAGDSPPALRIVPL
jgi:hypothetical protein